MRALVVYESMYGNTHAIADHIADGLREVLEVTVAPVAGAGAELLAGVDLLVVGAPTHAHSLPSRTTRESAVTDAAKKPTLPPLDPDAQGEGVREWFDVLPDGHGTAAAAFDTRVDMAELITGHASHGIAKRLKKHGYRLAVGPESFLVDKATHLVEGETERAKAWGAALASAFSATR